MYGWWAKAPPVLLTVDTAGAEFYTVLGDGRCRNLHCCGIIRKRCGSWESQDACLHGALRIARTDDIRSFVAPKAG